MMFPNIMFSRQDILSEQANEEEKLKTEQDIFCMREKDGESEALNYIRKTAHKILRGKGTRESMYLYPYGEAAQEFFKVIGPSVNIKGLIDNKKKGHVHFRGKNINIISFTEFLAEKPAERSLIFIISNKDKELKKVIDEQLQAMDKSLNDLKIEIYTLSDFLDDIVAWI